MLRRLSSSRYVSKVCVCKVTVRNSALFINGAKATETFTYITPHIDFVNRIKDRSKIQEQLNSRKSDINLAKVEYLWNIYEQLKSRKIELDKKREQISKQLGKIIKTPPDSQEINKLKIQMGLVKDNIRKLKVPLWSAEEAAIVEVLKLPNALHPKTPDCTEVLYKYLDPPFEKKNHLWIGKEENLLHFKNNKNYYLKGDAAIFELGAKFYFSRLLKKSSFTQFSNPDFVKSVIVEGCGENHTNPNATFMLHHNEDVSPDNRLHLTGGGSLCSFFAYLAKNVVPPKTFPLKYFAMGPKYVPSCSNIHSLFHVSQSSVIQIFGAAKSDTHVDEMLNELIDFLKTAYSQIDYHFRLTLTPAYDLEMWESLRLSLEMYSTSMNDYVEVANISLSGDFISKRLLFTYVENKKSKFPFVLSGTILNVPKFLGCVFEQDGNFVIPEQFKIKNWSIKV